MSKIRTKEAYYSVSKGTQELAYVVPSLCNEILMRFDELGIAMLSHYFCGLKAVLFT